MKKALIISIVTLFSVVISAQKTPTYSGFSVKVENKTAKKVNLKSHSEAKFFRTNLKKALANSEVNFAGKYILTYWGCGSGCTQGAIIDVHTGKVFFPLELQGVYAGGLSLGEHDMLEYKKDSNLLIIYGYAGGGFEPETATHHGIYYFQWNGKTFKLLKFIKKKE
jgi:hypothetical protein